VSTVYVSRIERYTTKVNLETLIKIYEFLDITRAYILTDSICSSEDYLRNEITDMLIRCSPEKIRFIADVINPIIEYTKNKLT